MGGGEGRKGRGGLARGGAQGRIKGRERGNGDKWQGERGPDVGSGRGQVLGMPHMKAELRL